MFININGSILNQFIFEFTIVYFNYVIIYVDESLTEYCTSHDKGGESYPR